MKEHGWFDLSTLKEPYRVEGKKTMGYELAEQLGWRLPDAIVYPTGGGTGLVGMWKAFDEMERARLDRRRAPEDDLRAGRRLRPDRAGLGGAARSSPSRGRAPQTYASGLRVPRAVGDFLILRGVRESGGAAVAVSDEEMERWTGIVGRLTGVFCAPEGAATAAAVPVLRERGVLSPDDEVVLFNTGQRPQVRAIGSRQECKRSHGAGPGIDTMPGPRAG